MAASPKLLDRVREAIRTRHYSRRTEEAYVHWIRRFIVFHELRHPLTMGADDIAAFLTWLAVHQHVSASTQNQALSALLFLYRHVLHMDVGAIERGWLLRLSRATFSFRASPATEGLSVVRVVGVFRESDVPPSAASAAANRSSQPTTRIPLPARRGSIPP